MLRRRGRAGFRVRQHRKTRQRGGSAAWGQPVGELLQERQPFGRHRAGLGGGNQRAARLDAVAAIMKTALADMGRSSGNS